MGYFKKDLNSKHKKGRSMSALLTPPKRSITCW
jgi:hypothetical protein